MVFHISSTPITKFSGLFIIKQTSRNYLKGIGHCKLMMKKQSGEISKIITNEFINETKGYLINSSVKNVVHLILIIGSYTI